jgi:predicted nucleotidyltransferase
VRRLPPVEAVIYAAEALGDLCGEVVFLGGAVVGLLVTDRGARPPRVTKDVDVTLEIVSLPDYYALEKRLLARGFKNDMCGPICRYLHGPLVIDVMPVASDILGFTNKWYPLAIQTAESYTFEGGLSISLITAPCFLATKLEAFEDAGREDHHDIFASRDFEDIVRVVDGRSSILEDVQSAHRELRLFLREAFSRLLAMDYLFEGVAEHVDPGREDLVLHRLAAIASP